MEVFSTYIIENFQFYIITVITLFVWNFTDLYIELKIFSFVRRKEFWVYYLVGVFFSIVAMEAGFLLGLFEIDNKAIIAFVAPLVFSIIIGNLVVKVGGVDTSINFSEFFEKFRFAIKTGLNTKKEMDRVKLQSRLLNSKIESDVILDYIRFYCSEEKEIQDLTDKIAKMEPRNKKIEVIKFLLLKAKTTDIIQMLEKQNA
jgi:hypothetical protein